jgi:hypothetical protein
MVLAHPAYSETDLASGIDHWASLIGRRRYASMAQFESSSLRRSPPLIMLAIMSERN